MCSNNSCRYSTHTRYSSSVSPRLVGPDGQDVALGENGEGTVTADDEAAAGEAKAEGEDGEAQDGGSGGEASETSDAVTDAVDQFRSLYIIGAARSPPKPLVLIEAPCLPVTATTVRWL